MRSSMKFWIILAVVLTPWFWSLPIPKNLFNINLAQDIKDARTQVEWERGKISSSSSNVLFSNWPERFISQRLSIVMENLDIGNYFFAGHPRERVGVAERQKFFIFEFVLLIIGLTSPYLKKYSKFLIIYSLAALSMVFIFKWRSFTQTLPLAIPFIIVMALGLERISHWSKKWLITFFSFSILEIIAFGIFYFNGFLR